MDGQSLPKIEENTNKASNNEISRHNPNKTGGASPTFSPLVLNNATPIVSLQEADGPSDLTRKRCYPFYEDGDPDISNGGIEDMENDGSLGSDADAHMSRYEMMPPDAEDISFRATHGFPVDREQILESCIPRTWSDDLQIAIETDSLSPIQQNEIIRRIADRMMAEGLKGVANFQDVAQLAIARIPCLGSRLAGSVGLASRLTACVRNKTNYAKRRARKEGYTSNQQELSHSDAEVMMREVMATEANPPLNKLKILLQRCRKGRLAELRTCLPAQGLLRYPALRLPEMILWEFEEIAHYRVDDLRAKWLTSVPKIQKLLHLKADVEGSMATATINILLKLEDHFPPRSKGKVTGRSILTVYREGTALADVAETLPEDSPPCLIAVGDKVDNLQITVFINRAAVFVGNAVEALLMLIALYWVFSVDFAPGSRLTLIFLNAVLMPTQMTNDIIKYRTVLAALEEMESGQ